jgi:hypothetical protein
MDFAVLWTRTKKKKEKKDLHMDFAVVGHGCQDGGRERRPLRVPCHTVSKVSAPV